MKKPDTPETQAAFLTERIFPMWRNDMTTVVEARCPTHSRSGHSANFTAALVCLITCESLADLAAPTGYAAGSQCRRWFWQDLGQVTGDPRYPLLGEPMFVWFRHGIAHRFIPKAAAAASGAAMFHLRSPEQSECAQDLRRPEQRAKLLMLRAEWHLRLDFSTFTILPQVLFVDTMNWLDGFETRLTAHDPPTLECLHRVGFDRWWDDMVTVRRTLLTSAEWDVVERRKPVPALRVKEYDALVSPAGLPVTFWMERTQNKWILYEDDGSTQQQYAFDDFSAADDQYGICARAWMLGERT